MELDKDRVIAEAILLSRKPMGMPHYNENSVLRPPYPRKLEDLEWEHQKAELLRAAHIVISQLQRHGFDIVEVHE